MIEGLTDIDWDASRHSIIHDIDARVKIILSFLVIILTVGYPLTLGVVFCVIPFAVLIAAGWVLSGLSVKTFISRFLVTLPFGFFIIFFQIFFKNPRALTATQIPLPFPFFPVYVESVESAFILLLKFLVCISAIILLSSTTPAQKMLEGGRRLGLPSVMALSLGMMIRYLFLFARMFCQIQCALKGRNFDPFDRNLPYMYRLQTLGYAMGSLFLRAYEQGERTYSAMICRGYGYHVLDHLPQKPLNSMEKGMLGVGIIVLPLMTLTIYVISG